MSKRAMFVGINNYAAGSDPLAGCLRDIDAWKKLLVDQYHFPDDEASIRIFPDDKATKDNVIAGLKWLLTQRAEVEMFVFVYSGHGTTFYSDVVSRSAEALVLYPGDETSLLTDWELEELLGGLDGTTASKLTIILDCCFAGGMQFWPVWHQPSQSACGTIKSAYRGTPLFAIKALTWRGRLIRWLASSRVGQWLLMRALPLRRFGAWSEEASGESGSKPLLLAASEKSQEAYETTVPNGDIVGAFSYAATQILSNRPCETYQDLIAKVVKEIGCKLQEPRVLCEDEKRISLPFLN